MTENTGTSTSTKSTTKTTAPAPTEAPAGDLAAQTQDLNTSSELAHIQANQDRYDARTSGQSSAEVNAEEQKAKAEGKEAPEVAPGGGQTLPAHDASGEAHDDAVVAEAPKA